MIILETIKVNLATFEYQDKRFSYPILIAIALIVLVLSFIFAQMSMNNQAEIREYEIRIQRLEQEFVLKKRMKEEKSDHLKAKEIESIKKGIDFINKLIISDIFPWDRLLDSLETSMPSGITLLKFDMTKDQKKMILQCKAKSINEISTFLSQLNDSKIFRNNILKNLSVEQKNSSEENIQGKEFVVKFEIESRIARDALLSSKRI